MMTADPFISDSFAVTLLSFLSPLLVSRVLEMTWRHERQVYARK